MCHLEVDIGEVGVSDPHILERYALVMLLALQSVHREQGNSLLCRHVEIRLQTVQHLSTSEITSGFQFSKYLFGAAVRLCVTLFIRSFIREVGHLKCNMHMAYIRVLNLLLKKDRARIMSYFFSLIFEST